MENKNRHSESGSVPFRTGRFYSVENEWWFAIRRGADQGPYETRQKAKESLTDFLNDQFAFERCLQEDKALLKHLAEKRAVRG